jgi:hypothetical protein
MAEYKGLLIRNALIAVVIVSTLVGFAIYTAGPIEHHIHQGSLSTSSRSAFSSQTSIYSTITTSPTSKTGGSPTTSSSSTSTSSASTQSNNPFPILNYIPTVNAKDSQGQISIYSALDTNTGTLGWVYETAQNDSLFTVSGNTLASEVASNMGKPPTSITFDSRNNITYATWDYPSLSAGGLIAISVNSIVSTPLAASVNSTPVGVSYDSQYDYLYVAQVSSIQTGIGVYDPNTGSRLALIQTSASPNSFAYDPNSGDMFVSVHNGANSTAIYDISGLSVVSNFNVTGLTGQMVYDPGNDLLYMELGSSIVVANPLYGNSTVLSLDSQNSLTTMVFDSQNQLVYAFAGDQMTMISGNESVTYNTTPYAVTSAFYVPQFNNMLAFY